MPYYNYPVYSFNNNNNNNNNLYCALNTKSVKTSKRNNCEKKRAPPLRNSRS